MQARFPLSFPGGDSDGFGNFPEIAQIFVEVNGKSVATKREMQPAISSGQDLVQDREEVPWSVFNVVFTPGQDVTIEVAYTISGYGYQPYEMFQYMLETGAGWNDTIGSADIIVQLPYGASSYNVWLPDPSTGYSSTPPGAVWAGNEVRWHFENLEPTAKDNLEVTIVSPALWKNVLQEQQIVTTNPNDGEAWGRLAKVYKGLLRSSKGELSQDAAGRELYQWSKAAYETCLSYLPNDSLWHYGYGDLLWAHYIFDVYLSREPDTEDALPGALNHLKTALELDPNNQLAKDLLAEISFSGPGFIEMTDNGFIFLALTATPMIPTAYAPSTVTSTALATLMATSPATSVPVTVSSIPSLTPPEKSTGSPICGGAGLMLPLMLGILWLSKRKIP